MKIDKVDNSVFMRIDDVGMQINDHTIDVTLDACKEEFDGHHWTNRGYGSTVALYCGVCGEQFGDEMFDQTIQEAVQRLVEAYGVTDGVRALYEAHGPFELELYGEEPEWYE